MMKLPKLKKVLVGLLALATVASVATMTACKTEGDDPMTTDTPTPSVTEPVTGIPTQEPTPTPLGEFEIRLTTKDATLLMEAESNKLMIKSLVTAGGVETVKEAGNYGFPKRVKTSLGTFSIDWRYKEKKMIEGTENGAKYEGALITYTCEKLNLQLNITVLARPELPGPFEFRSEVKNLSATEDVTIIPETVGSMTVKLGGDLVSIKKESGASEGYRHYDGTYFDGTGIYRTTATSGASVNAWVTTFQNFNASGYIPMIYQDAGTYGTYCALEWSCGRVIAKGAVKGITYTVDLNPEGQGSFKTVINRKDTFEVPSIYLGAYDGTLDNGSNGFKNWFFNCKAQERLRENTSEPLSQMDMQTGLDTHGIESIKWDYGWWSNEALGGWKSLEGSWQLRNTAYIGVVNGYGGTTLADFGEAAAKQGTNWTVYTLLHDTLNRYGKATDEFNEFNSLSHPEWFSNRCIAGGMGCSADLGNEDCVDFLKEELATFFSENKIGTWRSDFEPICYSSDKENRHAANGTDVMYWCSVGFRDIVTHLYDNVDNFRYESCSSGGSMKDLFTATLAISINTDDVANYMGMRATFYDSSYIIHPSQLQFPCNSDFFNTDCSTFWPKVSTTNPDKAAFKDAMLDMGYRTQCLGSPMFSSWTSTCMTDYYEEYSEMYATKMRPLIRDGELYHILPRPNGTDYDGVMYADPDSENELKGVVYLFKPSEKPGNTVHLTLQGLYADTTYQLTFEDRPEQNCTATGASLMSEGIDVEILYVGSELIWISEAK